MDRYPPTNMVDREIDAFITWMDEITEGDPERFSQLADHVKVKISKANVSHPNSRIPYTNELRGT